MEDNNDIPIKDRIVLENIKPQNKNKDKNNKFNISNKKMTDLKQENEKTEDDIIIQTDSCLDEQSFFKNLNNNLQDGTQTKLTQLTNEIISNMFNNRQINNPQNLDFDDLLFLQSLSPSLQKQKNNNKIIEEFIKRNNFVKENNNKNYNNNEEEDTIQENDISNNNNKENINNLLIFQQFYEREKKFENKLNMDKERRMKLKDIDLLNYIRDKPNICEKSQRLAHKKNSNTKVFNRLYENAFSTDKKKKNEENENKSKINKLRKKSNIFTTNINQNQNQNIKSKSQKKFGLKKRNYSTNNLRYNNDIVKNDNSINNDEENIFKEKNKMFLSKDNSKTNIKKIQSSIIKESVNNNTGSKFSKSTYKYRNVVKKECKDKLFNEYNSQTATEKMTIVQINKINFEIDNLLSIEKTDTEKYGINFYLFCDLLFKLGYVYILHKKNNIITNNINILSPEYLKELEVQLYLEKSLITKDFIFNEIKIINNAFNSIINNFKIPQELNEQENNNNNNNNDIEKMISENKNKRILIEDFKLFIFILSETFIGYKIEAQKTEREHQNVNTKIKNLNKSTHSNKTNKSTTINNSNISRGDKLKNNNKILNLLKKIIPNKKLNTYTYKDILDYKTYFQYMINIKNNHLIFLNNKKKIVKKEQLEQSILNRCTFSPKTNRNKDLILNSIKPNMNFEERNEIISKKKSKHKLELQNELNQEYIEQYTFSPKLNGNKSIQYLKRMKQKLEKEKIEKQKNNINVIKSQEPEKKNSIEIDDLAKFSFNPTKMFSQSPLANDKLVNDKIKKLRNFNFTKKLNNFEKNNREILNSNVKKDKLFINYLINNANEGRMRLSVDKKTNKDTFDKYKNINKNNDDESGYKSNVFEILNSKNKFRLFCMEVKIKNENHIIEVFHNDDFEKLCLDFCKKHNLGVDSYNQILESIKNKIKEINEYSL